MYSIIYVCIDDDPWHLPRTWQPRLQFQPASRAVPVPSSLLSVIDKEARGTVTCGRMLTDASQSVALRHTVQILQYIRQYYSNYTIVIRSAFYLNTYF